MKLFLDVLARHNVTQVNPLGELFNPQFHEAMSTQISAEVAPNTVLTVFQKGYLLNDRMIRPARVIVAKA
jgi:molecular chaperone GrpE